VISQLNEVVSTIWTVADFTFPASSFIAVQIPKNHGGVKISAIEFGATVSPAADGDDFRIYAIGLIALLDKTKRIQEQIEASLLLQPPFNRSIYSRFYMNYARSPVDLAGASRAFSHSDIYFDPIKLPGQTDIAVAMSVVAGAVNGSIVPWLIVRGEVSPEQQGDQEVQL
jgi:hypothetical protein